jgi:hypothetical protein
MTTPFNSATEGKIERSNTKQLGPLQVQRRVLAEELDLLSVPRLSPSMDSKKP